MKLAAVLERSDLKAAEMARRAEQVRCATEALKLGVPAETVRLFTSLSANDMGRLVARVEGRVSA